VSNKDVWGCPSKGHGHLCTRPLSKETEGEKEKKECVYVCERTKDRQKQRKMNKATHIRTDFALCKNLIPLYGHDQDTNRFKS